MTGGFGNKMRALRKLHGMSARQLSEATGGAISRHVICDLEIGRASDPRSGQAVAVAAALGVGLRLLVDDNVTVEEVIGLQRVATLEWLLAEAQHQLNEAIYEGIL